MLGVDKNLSSGKSNIQLIPKSTELRWVEACDVKIRIQTCRYIYIYIYNPDCRKQLLFSWKQSPKWMSSRLILIGIACSFLKPRKGQKRFVALWPEYTMHTKADIDVAGILYHISCRGWYISRRKLSIYHVSGLHNIQVSLWTAEQLKKQRSTFLRTRRKGYAVQALAR